MIFVVLAMKAHMLASQSIRVQGLELLTRMLEFVKKEHNRGESKGVTGTGEYPKQESSYVRDAVHQMLLHGAAAILVRLLSYSMDSASETNASFHLLHAVPRAGDTTANDPKIGYIR